MLTGNISHFEPDLYTLIAGPQQASFPVHKEKLIQSPVFKRMINSGFNEAQTRTIDLPEDDPRTLSLFVEYLYRGDYWPFIGSEFDAYRSEHEDQRALQMRREADIYCFAAMYDTVLQMEKYPPRLAMAPWLRD